MGRSYQAILQQKNGKLRRFPGESWSVNVWGAHYWGHFWEHLGLPVNYYSGAVMLPYEFIGDDFLRCKERLNVLSEEDIWQAVLYANQKMQHSPQRREEEIDYFKTQVLPHFQKRNAVGVVSDYTDLMTLIPSSDHQKDE